MTETKDRSVPGIVGVPLDWVHHKWNETRWGFPEGHVRRIQMEALLKQDKLSLHGVQQLLHLMGETHKSGLQLRMSEKIRDSVDQLVEAQRPRRPRQMDMQALSNYINRVVREEGLD